MASQIYEQLVAAYTNTDNQVRNQAEKSLVNSMQENYQNFQFIAQLAEKQDQMQEQAANLLNSVVMKILNTNPNQLTIQHAESLISVLTSQNTPLKYKQSLIQSLSQISRKNKNVKIEIERKMKEYLQGEQQWQIQTGILFFKILADSVELQNFSNYGNVITTSYEWITEYFNQFVQIMAVLQDQPKDLSDEFKNTMKYFAQSIQDLCDKIQQQSNISREQILPILNILFSLNSFSGSLILLLQYSPQIGKQMQNSIIMNTGIQIFDDKMNEIKSYILKSYMIIFQILLNTRNKSEVKKGPFGPYLNPITQLLLYSILTYTNSETTNVILNKPFLRNIITYILKLLANLGSQTEQYQIFSDSKVPLITDVIYPYLITSQQEYQKMNEEPEEFVNLALDTVDKQESDIPKTAAAQLLETLCDHIDGSTTFLANLAVIITQNAINNLSSKPVSLNEQQQTFIQAISDKKLFTEYNAVDRIESSLIVLTIMSYLIQKRFDIVSMMEQLLTENLIFFQNIQHQIIKVRFSLFFGYYCDNLFKKDIQSQSMLMYLSILINFVQPKEPVVLYQSIDALKDVFEDDELKTKTKGLVTVVFPSLCNGLTFSIYERHFEMIINLLKRYPQVFQQNENLLIGLMQILVQRIIQEQELINNGDSQRHIYLNRCWNIIRSLADQNEYTNLLVTLEQSITQLYQMLAICQKIDFDEDLILFISLCIQKLSSVTALQMQVLPHFMNVIQKQNCRLGNLYETLNYYIHYGRNHFIDEQYQQIFFNLAFQHLQSDQSFEDIEQAEGALLIQLGIQELNQDLKKNILEQILNQTVTMISKKELTGLLRSRITGIILSALYSVPELTCEILSGMFLAVYNQVLDTQYSPGYDIKLFVITMSSLINKQHNLLTPKLITTIVNNLFQQEKFEKETELKKLNSSFDGEDFDEEDDDDEDFNDQDDISEAQQQIEQFLSPIVKVDEYSVFKNTLFTIKQQYVTGIEQLKKELDNQIVAKLNELMSFVRISTNDGIQPTRKLIKAQRRKKNN
ncbi:unnamed protein product [Paramecium primaurelia]|uniref:Uncharacterized protein n=1 Tax=Paramecium primaurelia TaxID=5886 RepID=A0A8S1L6B0_PARPR|nr:unnamed protein product [Paramecium primaurelia]